MPEGRGDRRWWLWPAVAGAVIGSASAGQSGEARLTWGAAFVLALVVLALGVSARLAVLRRRQRRAARKNKGKGKASTGPRRSYGE